MGWKDRAIDDLKLLGVRRQAVEGLRAQIADVEADAVNLTGSSGGTPIKGGGNRQEKKLCTYIDRKMELEAKESLLRLQVRQTERALAALGKTERAVLVTCFCEGQRPGKAIRELEGRLHMSQATIYRVRERALYNFAYIAGYL